MKLFTVKLTDEERTKLEAHRASLGLRSQSDVIRHWIGRPLLSDEPWDNEELPGLAQVVAKQMIDAETAKGTRVVVYDPLPTRPVNPGPLAPLRLGPVTPPPGSRLKKR